MDAAQRTRKGRVLVYDTSGQMVKSFGPSILGQCSHLGAVEGEIIDATDVAMFNNDTLLVSHCFRPAPVSAGEFDQRGSINTRVRARFN